MTGARPLIRGRAWASIRPFEMAGEREVVREVVHSPGAPRAVGPYSQAIRAGDLVFTSGQIPLDPSTGQLVEGGIEEQTRRVMENLRAVLEAAGATFEHVVKAT